MLKDNNAHKTSSIAISVDKSVDKQDKSVDKIIGKSFGKSVGESSGNSVCKKGGRTDSNNDRNIGDSPVQSSCAEPVTNLRPIIPAPETEETSAAITKLQNITRVDACISSSAKDDLPFPIPSSAQPPESCLLQETPPSPPCSEIYRSSTRPHPRTAFRKAAGTSDLQNERARCREVRRKFSIRRSQFGSTQLDGGKEKSPARQSEISLASRAHSNSIKGCASGADVQRSPSPALPLQSNFPASGPETGSVQRATQEHERRNLPSDERTRSAMAKIVGLTKELRSAKQKIEEQDLEIRELRRDRSALILTVNTTQEKITEKDREIETLKASVQLSRAKSSRNRSSLSNSRRKGKIGPEMAKFMSIVHTLEIDMPKLVEWEAGELEFYEDGHVRCWAGRAHEVPIGHGLLNFGDQEYIPKCPFDLALTHDFHTSSGPVEEILEDAVRVLLEDPKWEKVFNEEDRRECIEQVPKCAYLQTSFRLTLNDRLSNKKRLVRDKFFGLLGYNLIAVRNVDKISHHDKTLRDGQIKELQEKLLHSVSGTVDTSYWRTASLNDLKYSDASIDSFEKDLSKDVFFRNAIGPQILQAFLGYNPRKGSRAVDTTILFLARLDAWIMTCVKMLDKKTGRGGQRQRMFQEAFSEYLDISITSVLLDIRETVRSNAEDEMNRNESECGNPKSVPIHSSWRKATVVKKMPDRNQLYLSVLPEWFNKNISSMLGNVCDAFAGWCEFGGPYFQEFQIDGDWSLQDASTRKLQKELSNSSMAMKELGETALIDLQES